MKSCISGSSGFIGSHLCERLLSEGHVVKTIPREILYSYYELQDYIEFEKPDFIWHLAASGNHSNQTDENEIFYSNVEVTWRLLRASRNTNYTRFINFGSSSEYGLRYSAMSEIDLCNPQTVYGGSKLATTAICMAYANANHKPITTVRPFSVYGPGEAEHRFIPRAIKFIKYDTEFELNPMGVHDWVFIDDFVDALMVLVSERPVRLLNIGTGTQHSNLDVYNILQSIAKVSKPYQHAKPKLHDSAVWFNGSIYIRELGWRPKHSLAEGLAKTYERY